MIPAWTSLASRWVEKLELSIFHVFGDEPLKTGAWSQDSSNSWIFVSLWSERSTHLTAKPARWIKVSWISEWVHPAASPLRKKRSPASLVSEKVPVQKGLSFKITFPTAVMRSLRAIDIFEKESSECCVTCLCLRCSDYVSDQNNRVKLESQVPHSHTSSIQYSCFSLSTTFLSPQGNHLFFASLPTPRPLKNLEIVQLVYKTTGRSTSTLCFTFSTCKSRKKAEKARKSRQKLVFFW